MRSQAKKDGEVTPLKVPSYQESPIVDKQKLKQMQSEDDSLQKYWDRGDVLVKGQAEVSFEVKGRILYHIYKHPFVNGGKAGVALWPFFYVASYIVPQICHDIYATGVLELSLIHI